MSVRIVSSMNHEIFPTGLLATQVSKDLTSVCVERRVELVAGKSASACPRNEYMRPAMRQIMERPEQIQGLAADASSPG
jgi:hypothetical protein